MSNILSRKSIQNLYDQQSNGDGAIVVDDPEILRHLAFEKGFAVDALITTSSKYGYHLAVFGYNDDDEYFKLHTAINAFQNEQEKFAEFDQTLFEMRSIVAKNPDADEKLR